MTRIIPGVLDMRGLDLLTGRIDDETYRQLADKDRPGPDGLKAEAKRLFHGGLTARDIAVALRLSEPVVQQWLAEVTS